MSSSPLSPQSSSPSQVHTEGMQRPLAHSNWCEAQTSSLVLEVGNRIVDFVNLVVFVDVIDLRAAAVVASRRGNSSVQITSTFSIVINFITREIRLGSFGCRFQRRALRSQPPVSSRRPNQLDFFCFDCRFKGNSQHTRLSPKLQAPTPNFFFNFSNQFSPFSLLKQQNRHGREKFKISFFFLVTGQKWLRLVAATTKPCAEINFSEAKK